VASTPNYGFRLNDTKDGLVVCEPEMLVIEKIFRMAAEGLGLRAMQSRLRAEGISAPKGGQTWSPRVLRRLVNNDVYLPRIYEEIARLVSPDTLARLDPANEYGIQWYNRQRVRMEPVSEPDGKGRRRYRKRRISVWRPKEEWVAVPVLAYLDRDLVERAHAPWPRPTGAWRESTSPESGSSGASYAARATSRWGPRPRVRTPAEAVTPTIITGAAGAETMAPAPVRAKAYR
jgi:hypothetical protein